MQNFRRRKSFLADRKAYSGIIATIFMVLIALFLFFNVFMFVLDRNTAFQDSASQTNQLVVDRNTEKFSISTPTYAIDDATHQVSVSVNVINVSPLSVLIKSVWIKDSVASNPNYNYTAKSIALQPGQSTILSASVVISNASSLDIGSCTSWFVTARGRTISTIQSESIGGSGSGNGACAALLFGISGANLTSPFDVNPSAKTGASAITNAGIPSITTTNANDFIIGVLGVQNGTLNPSSVEVHPNPPYGMIGSPQVDASKSRFTAGAYRIVSATNTYNPDFAWGSPYAGTWGVILDAIKKNSTGNLAYDPGISSFVTSGNTLTLTILTHAENEVLYLSWVGNSGQTITGVSTGGSSPTTSSWNPRARVSADNGGPYFLETWYAISTLANRQYSVIITMSNSGS